MMIYLAIMLIPLLGLCGLVVDVGRIETRSLQLQTAADDAAIAYALESGRRGNVSSSNFTTMANSELTAWATANNIPVPTLSLQSGASTGPYANNSMVVQATVQQTISTMMIGVLSTGNKSVQLSRTAVAALPPCSTVYTSLAISGSTLTLNCPVVVGTALTVDGLSSITGNTLVTGAASASSVAGLVTPATIYNWPSETHPDSYATYNTGGSCVATNLNVNNNLAAVMTPGMYCNSTTISNSIVTLQPGLYTMQGGMTVTNSTLSGGPVEMIMEKNSSGAGQFILTSAIWNLSAPATPYGTGLGAILVACVVPVGTTNTWGTSDIQFTHATITADGIISCGLVGSTITSSSITSAGHFFSFVFSKSVITGTTLTTNDDYSQLPGGSPHAYTVNIVQ